MQQLLHYLYMDATKKVFSIKEAADLLGVDRVTVFRWIKAGKLKATQVGRSFVISAEDLPHHILGGLPEERKAQIRETVSKALEEYGETFSALAKE